MKTVFKVGAFVIRRSPAADVAVGRAQVLLFTHLDFPDVPPQIPGGGLEPGEEPLAGAVRELREESGQENLPLLRFIGTSESPWHIDPTVTMHRHCYLFDGEGLPDHWIHEVTGSGEDHKLRFEYRWHTVTPDLQLAGNQGYFLTREHLPELFERPSPKEPATHSASFAILISGPINSGKSTVSRALRELRPRLAHIEVDALGDFLPEMPLEEKIALSLRQATVVARTLLDAGISVVVSYPLREEEHMALRSALAPFAVHTVTLAPPRELAQTNRGTRALTDWEHERIDHHYTTDLHRPSFGHVLDNSTESPSATAARILTLVAN